MEDVGAPPDSQIRRRALIQLAVAGVLGLAAWLFRAAIRPLPDDLSILEAVFHADLWRNFLLLAMSLTLAAAATGYAATTLVVAAAIGAELIPGRLSLRWLTIAPIAGAVLGVIIGYSVGY